MLDEFRSTSITWDKATRRIYSPITANASDSNGRKLNIQVVNSGQIENLTGATLHLYWETKDKTQQGLDAFTASDISKGEFELFYTTGMLSNVGELNATLVLVDSTGKVVSDWFKITVARGIDGDAIQSENSFTTLTQALIDISNLEQNYAPRLNDLTAQLQQKAQQSNRLTTAYDAFNRPDGLLTHSEDGQTYINTADDNESRFHIKDKKAVIGDGVGTAYMSLSAGGQIETMGAEFIIEPNTSNEPSTVAVCLMGDDTLAFKYFLHWYTYEDKWLLQIHDSGVKENPLQWRYIEEKAYDKPLIADGKTIHRVEFTVDVERKTVYIKLPDNTLYTLVDDSVPLIAKHRGFWEIIRSDNAKNEPKFTNIWLTKKDDTRPEGASNNNSVIYPMLKEIDEKINVNAYPYHLLSFTPTSVGWHRIYTYIGFVIGGKLNIYAGNHNSDLYDATTTDTEFEFSMTPYSSSGHTVTQLRNTGLNGGIVPKIRLGSDGAQVMYVDIYVASATNPKPLYIKATGTKLLSALNQAGQNVVHNPPLLNPNVPVHSTEVSLMPGLLTNRTLSGRSVNAGVEIVTASGNASANYSITAIDATTADVTLQLPSSVSLNNHTHVFSRVDSTDRIVKVHGFYSDGTTTKELVRGVPLRVVADSTENRWIII